MGQMGQLVWTDARLFKFKMADKYDCLAARATQWMNNSAVS
jgi:hypothetical protein